QHSQYRFTKWNKVRLGETSPSRVSYRTSSESVHLPEQIGQQGSRSWIRAKPIPIEYPLICIQSQCRLFQLSGVYASHFQPSWESFLSLQIFVRASMSRNGGSWRN